MFSPDACLDKDNYGAFKELWAGHPMLGHNP